MAQQNFMIDRINTPQKAGLALRRMRRYFKLSQSALAKKMELRQPTISAIENGKCTLESFFKIVRALNLELAVNTGSFRKKTKKNKTQIMIDLISNPK